MNRFLIAIAVLANAGVVMAQPNPGAPNPFNQPSRGGITLPRGIGTNAISQAEEAVLLRHFEKLLEMKLETELQMELAQVKKGANHPDTSEMKTTAEILAMRIDLTRAKLEEKIKIRQAQLEKQMEKQMRERTAPQGGQGAGAENSTLKMYILAHAQAKDIVPVVKEMNHLGPIQINVDARTNGLLIMASVKDQEKIAGVISKLDGPPEPKKEPKKEPEKPK